ncbi:hypothetical protein AVEN_209527-1 [Araneus ventricosus]|uniref:Uncharacterized protein n=1 Tax=Araneus ventricosus TaxID=182803 RepID=A0A4Y2N7V0_ARAVE|nr:hypothetical protein AVEN_209527-1 [Araneus ventricosus]
MSLLIYRLQKSGSSRITKLWESQKPKFQILGKGILEASLYRITCLVPRELSYEQKPSDPVHRGLKAVYMQKDLQTCSHVFVRGPIKGFGNAILKVIFPSKRQDKNVTGEQSRKSNSVDRLKPAFPNVRHD